MRGSNNRDANLYIDDLYSKCIGYSLLGSHIPIAIIADCPNEIILKIQTRRPKGVLTE